MIPGQNSLCIALDTPDLARAVTLAKALSGTVGYVKLGMEFYYAHGPKGYAQVAAMGVPVFLDLKLHDIPNTVASAVRRAVDLDVRYLTLHASGGPAMMRQAAQAAQSTSTVLLAVTILTSLGDDELLRAGHVGGAVTLVPMLATLAAESRIGGVVCSPLEIAAVKRVAPDLVIVTPGVRGVNDASDDQTRTRSAAEAIQAGAPVVVVGRPIKNARDPIRAARQLAKEIASTST